MIVSRSSIGRDLRDCDGRSRLAIIEGLRWDHRPDYVMDCSLNPDMIYNLIYDLSYNLNCRLGEKKRGQR